MLQRVILIGLIFLVLYSCESNSYPLMGNEFVPGQVIEINLDKSLDLKLSDLFERIEYIPLESREETLVLDALVIPRFLHDRFYLYKDDSEVDYLAVFDRQGQLLQFKRFDNAGPGAVIGGNDFWINPDHSLEILDRYQKKIIVFDEDFQFVRTITLPANFSRMIKLTDQSYWLYANYDYNPEQHLFFHVDAQGAIIDSDVSYPPEFTGLGKKKINTEKAYQNTGYFFYPHYQQNIYQVDDEGLSLAYSFDFGNQEAIEDALVRFSNNFTDKAGESVRYKWFDQEHNQQIKEIFGLSDTEEVMICSVAHQDERHWLLYHKQLKKSISIRQLENDLDFGPINIVAPLSGRFGNDAVLIMIPAYLLTEHLAYLDALMEQDPELDYTLNGKNAFYQLKGRVKEHDNPVLAVAYLKQDLSGLFATTR